MTRRKCTSISLGLVVGAGLVAAPVAAGETLLRQVQGVAMERSEAGTDNATRHRWRGTRDCMPADALGQAVADGIRRPDVSGIDRRNVVVEGHGRFGWGRMVFANTAGCPLILH